MKYNRKNECCEVPFSVNISVTEECPLRCPMCFRPYDEKRELKPETIFGYIDQLSSLGSQYVQFSGGEPLIYPHLSQVILHAKNKKLKTHISTSGIGMTDRMAKLLESINLDYCHLSLNGSSARIHELSRDSFDETIQAMHVLSKTTIPTSINWVANHKNVSDLPNLIHLAKQFGIKYITLLANKKNNRDDVMFSLTHEDLLLLKHCCETNSEYLVVESCFYELESMLRPRKTRSIEYGCRAGRFYMAISARNTFSPCPHLPETEQCAASIEEYWNNDAKLILMRKRLYMNSQVSCQHCVHQKLCSPCLSEIIESNTSNRTHQCLLYQKKEALN